ncbi:MAG: 6-carboxytetrahydropterin synthase [Candidatus Thiothrix putei]|uniref:6-carboxy-5,6,7,8-tetrahydropterin synthase n=1 Tax=Candidatus Thiothrix putei TaxID=3080811 RepID=A0AA95HJR8_9GAMM|nr:MAG: 6-carboxytetrahydropterin synthase [Candidatus Thiothrix putei]
MHGHGFEVILHANQNLQAQDMGVDFDHLAAVWQPLHDQLHHTPAMEYAQSNLRGMTR